MNGNQIILIGQVGDHLQASTMRNGDRRVALRVFTRYPARNEQGKKTWHSQWHDIIAWREQALFAERNLVKGSRVLIQGCIEYRTFMDRKEHKRYITRVRAFNFQNLDR